MAETLRFVHATVGACATNRLSLANKIGLLDVQLPFQPLAGTSRCATRIGDPLGTADNVDLHRQPAQLAWLCKQEK